MVPSNPAPCTGGQVGYAFWAFDLDEAWGCASEDPGYVQRALPSKEALGLLSAVSNGFDAVHLFMYPHQCCTNVPSNVVQRDATPFLSWQQANRLHDNGVPVAHISDCVRITAAATEGGTVLDLDLMWLKRTPPSPYIATLLGKKAGWQVDKRYEEFARNGWDGRGRVNTPIGVVPKSRFARSLLALVADFVAAWTKDMRFEPESQWNVLMHGIRDIVLELGMGQQTRPPIEFGAALSWHAQRKSILADHAYDRARNIYGTDIPTKQEILAKSVAVPTSFALATRHGVAQNDDVTELCAERPNSLLAAVCRAAGVLGPPEGTSGEM